MSYSIDLKSNVELHDELHEQLSEVLDGEVADAYEQDSDGSLEELFFEAEGRILQAMDLAMETALDEEMSWLRKSILEKAGR